ncbi:PepSY domain-containing protein [Streptomyces sp. Je 1-79]|uniref:PepSY domain-containing protein n=1 Tax=Streptomyces sp. Je 1-79 TaxID=2943847 RepID=UPI0021A7856E|nr:PepSY domain-containing protein [Streptomyces sp. Je 1-79]MCT4354362.1 PepSY domain-containing protein [Streptomyces sp. Je 1-79]
MKRNIVIATVAAAAVVCGGTAVAFADDDGSRDDRTAVRSAKVTAVQAIGTALKAQPGTAVSADLDDDGRGWEVDVLGAGTTSYTVQVDAGTGKVLGKETDRDDDRDDADDRRALKGASVDARKAAEAASAKGAVTSVSLDDDDRAAAAWDMDTVNGDWRVDLKTGQVTADDDGQDGRDEDDRDDRAEAAGHADDTADDDGNNADADDND